MQEKSRQKWVDLSDKLEAEKKAIEDKAAWKEAELRADVVRAERKSTMVAVGGTPGGVECRVMFRQGVVERSLSDRQLDRIRTMPPLIRAMTQDSNAWVVGSQAEFREGRVNIKPTSDWDVIVPYAEWQDVMTRLASAGVLVDAKFTSVGGVRTTIPAKNGGTVGLDIWPGEISHHMMKPFTHVAWQPKTGSVWVRGGVMLTIQTKSEDGTTEEVALNREEVVDFLVRCFDQAVRETAPEDRNKRIVHASTRIQFDLDKIPRLTSRKHRGMCDLAVVEDEGQTRFIIRNQYEGMRLTAYMPVVLKADEAPTETMGS